MPELAKLLKRLDGKIPEDLERALLARSRTLFRRDRDRIKAGRISREKAKRNAEAAAVEEFRQEAIQQLNRLNDN